MLYYKGGALSWRNWQMLGLYYNMPLQGKGGGVGKDD